MERLRQSDLQALLRFVSEQCAIQEFESFDNFVQRLVDASSHLIPCADVVYNDMNPLKKESRCYASNPEMITPVAKRRWSLAMNDHPALQQALHSRHTPILRISDFWSQRQLHNSRLYNECFRYLNIQDGLSAGISASLPRVVGIAWHSQRNFTGREQLLVELVRPHIVQAWQNARLIGQMQNQLRMLVQGIDTLGAGTIFCGPGDEVQFINAEARRCLAKYFGASRQLGRRLPDLLAAWARQQDSYLEPNGDAPAVRHPLVRIAGNDRLTIRLLSNPGSMLFLLVEEVAPTAPHALQSLGLTARETEVLHWIACGKTNSEIAIILGMSVSTAKKHTEHILQKLGVETRTAAAALALARDTPPRTSNGNA